MATIYEGTGKPKIVFEDTTYYVLPEPIGPEKDGLRVYDFDIFTRDQYWSVTGNKNNLGKKLIFKASLKWVSMDKDSLAYLWKAEKENNFSFYLNEDKSAIHFKCEVVALNYKFFEGIPDHPAGYSVELGLRGTEHLSSAGYGVSSGTGGWGTHWGVNTENQ